MAAPHLKAISNNDWHITPTIDSLNELQSHRTSTHSLNYIANHLLNIFTFQRFSDQKQSLWEVFCTSAWASVTPNEVFKADPAQVMWVSKTKWVWKSRILLNSLQTCWQILPWLIKSTMNKLKDIFHVHVG